eukprot:Em0001g2802a
MSSLNYRWAHNPDKIQLSLLTAPAVDPPVFQLNCTSTRSPATIVKWTINGSTAEGGRFASYQILKDPVSSTYENIPGCDWKRVWLVCVQCYHLDCTRHIPPVFSTIYQCISVC